MPKAKAVKIGEIHTIDDEQPVSEEAELLTFLDSLGPSGVVECSLYRLTPTGKQKFICAGAPQQFTESWVQESYGGGDYMLRAKLNSKWFKSKMFSIEGPHMNGNHSPLTPAPGVELERLKADLEQQRLRLQEQTLLVENERREREARAHELQLAMLQNRESSHAQMAEMITGLKALHDLSGPPEQSLSTLERSLGIISRITEIRSNTAGGGGEGWLDVLKPVAGEVGKALIPRVLTWLSPPPPAPPAAAGPTAPPATPPPGPALTPGLPEVRMEPDGTPEPPADAQPETTPTSTGDAEQDFRIMKAQALAYIIPIARMNRDPEFYASLAIEQIEVTSNPVIARFLTEIQGSESFEIWFRELQAIDSTIITSGRWFEIFFNSVREILNSKQEEESAEK